jgi:hypothetical protein
MRFRAARQTDPDFVNRALANGAFANCGNRSLTIMALVAILLMYHLSPLYKCYLTNIIKNPQAIQAKLVSIKSFTQ